MKKSALMKISTDFSGINKMVKLTSTVTTIGKVLVVAMLVFTALDAYSVLKKAG